MGESSLVRQSNEQPFPSLPARFPLKVPLLGGLAAALITAGVVIHQAASPLAEDPAANDRLDSTRAAQSADRRSFQEKRTAERVARARFYDTTVTPLIAEVDAKNRAAVDRCLERIDHVLQGYHEGVELFVDEMTSLTTRLGVIKRMPGGWWSGDGRVEAYVQEKFETHLFSEQKLINDISGALFQFRDEVNANQTWMLTRVQAALTTADLPGVQLAHQEDFFRELSTRLGSYAAGQGTTSVENMIGAFVLGEVGAFAGRSIVAGLLVRFAPSVAIGSAATASATVGASATGAGGGSLGGPVGAAVGFGAGLAIGLVIDWWMTEKFEAELSRQMHVYLYDLEAALISGGKASGAATITGNGTAGSDVAASGLEKALPRVCDQLRNAYRDRFYQQIVDGESS